MNYVVGNYISPIGLMHSGPSPIIPKPEGPVRHFGEEVRDPKNHLLHRCILFLPLFS